MKLAALKPGDRIRLVSPASPIAEEKIKPIKNLLESEGYEVEISPHALLHDGYLAGSDQERAEDLQSAFEDPGVAGIICNRGGYGCARLLPLLDFDRMVAKPKILAGFSDITTLHLALNKRGMPTLHSPMALTLAYEREPWVIDSFLRALKGDLEIHPNVPRGKTLNPGKASGLAVGGCMCLLTDSIGTSVQLDAWGKILFIEDVDEAPHRVDAMLTHLLNAGILQSACGIVFGEMTRTDQRADMDIGARSWRDIVRERTHHLDIPIILEFPFGHAKNMLTLGFGIQVEVDADLGTVKYLEPLCV